LTEPRDGAIERVIAVVLVFAGHALLLSVASGVLIAVLLAPPLGIPLAVLFIVALAAIAAACHRGATGRWSFAAGLASAAASLGSLLVFRLLGAEAALGTVDMVPVLAALEGAAVASLFIGQRLWIAGLAILAATAVAIAVPQAVSSSVQQAELEASKQEQLAQTLAAYAPAVTADLTGATLSHVSPDGQGTSLWLTTADGGVMMIASVMWTPEVPNDAAPCWVLEPGPGTSADTGTFDAAVTLQDYSGICSQVGDTRWKLDDGTAIALEHDGIIVIVAAVRTEDVEVWDLPRTATSEELEQATDALRTLSKAELKALLRWGN
jgi:hypothetical protein